MDNFTSLSYRIDDAEILIANYLGMWEGHDIISRGQIISIRNLEFKIGDILRRRHRDRSDRRRLICKDPHHAALMRVRRWLQRLFFHHKHLPVFAWIDTDGGVGDICFQEAHALECVIGPFHQQILSFMREKIVTAMFVYKRRQRKWRRVLPYSRTNGEGYG